MKNKSTSKPVISNLLRNIEIVNEKLEKSKLTQTALESVKLNLKFIAKKVGITQNQAMLFSIIFKQNFSPMDVCISTIADFFDCSCLQIASMMPDFEELTKKKLIRNSSARNSRKREKISDIEYYVSKDVFEKIIKGNFSSSKKQIGELSLIELLSELYEIYDNRYNDDMNFYELNEEVESLLSLNKELNLVKQIKRLKLNIEEIHILLILAGEALNRYKSVDLDVILRKLYKDEMAEKFRLRKKIIKSSLDLFKYNFVKLEDNNFKSDRLLQFTDDGLGFVFGEEKNYISFCNYEHTSNMILAQNIKPKALFYNDSENSQIELFSSTLEMERFQQLQKRLKEQKLPEGIAALFYGPAGTGKTETVYQLAAQTGRDILMVDISSTKSMWFGESEKLIKKVFTQYKTMVENTNNTPILLFNEADAIFSKRLELNSAGVDQTRNSIQNIILQELETLNGILIATTNLTQNFDKAFERRFLFKILFEKPTPQIQCKIWQSKLPLLTIEEAMNLSQKFGFTGGQIDNVCRKIITHQIVNGDEPNFGQIEKFCYEEMLSKERSRIGFINK